MLLFWRKRAQARKIERSNARRGERDSSVAYNYDPKKTLILLLVLHVYIALCAWIFQRLEYVEAKSRRPNLERLVVNMSEELNISNENAMKLIGAVINAAEQDRKVYVRSLWGQFSKAFWYVTILFTTVGTGHIVTATFYGRLFTIITALIGIPLYALFLKHFGDCILQGNRKLIKFCESGKDYHRRGANKNTKLVLLSFLEMIFIIFMGALGAFPFKWTYFEGVYFCFISLSTVGFGDLIPDLSGDKAIFGIIYMFYNVIGLAFVSCFICSVVNAIDDFKAMKETAKWAAGSLRKTAIRATACYSSKKFTTPGKHERNGNHSPKAETKGGSPQTMTEMQNGSDDLSQFEDINYMKTGEIFRNREAINQI